MSEPASTPSTTAAAPKRGPGLVVGGIAVIAAIVMGGLYLQERGEHETAVEELAEARTAQTAAETAAAESERARETAVAEQGVIAEQYQHFAFLQVLESVRRLDEEYAELIGARPELIARLEAWIDSAEKLLPHHDFFDAAHRHLVAKGEVDFRGTIEDERDSVIEWMEEGKTRLSAWSEAGGRLAEARQRIAKIEEWRAQATEEAWRAKLAAIVADNPRYEGIELDPIFGVESIGKDPVSGLAEFAWLPSGTPPTRDAEGRLEITEGSAAVFVLIPPGTILKPIFPDGMWGIQIGEPTGRGLRIASVAYSSIAHALGIKAGDELLVAKELPGKAPNPRDGKIIIKVRRGEEELEFEQATQVDPNDLLSDDPIGKFEVKPYLISKYEWTEAQWKLLHARGEGEDEKASSRLPVVSVDGEDLDERLARFGLAIPNADQWDFAASGGTPALYWTGPTPDTLKGAENLPGFVEGGGERRPVGSFRDNPYGLFDMLGNVWEWCRWVSTNRDTGEETTYFVRRGGSWRVMMRADETRVPKEEEDGGFRPVLER